jgi:hypothetical protein
VIVIILRQNQGRSNEVQTRLVELPSTKLRIGDLFEHFELESKALICPKEPILPLPTRNSAALGFLHGKSRPEGSGCDQERSQSENENENENRDPRTNGKTDSDQNKDALPAGNLPPRKSVRLIIAMMPKNSLNRNQDRQGRAKKERPNTMKSEETERNAVFDLSNDLPIRSRPVQSHPFPCQLTIISRWHMSTWVRLWQIVWGSHFGLMTLFVPPELPPVND